MRHACGLPSTQQGGMPASARPVACSGPLQSLLQRAEWALRLPCWALGQAPHVGCTASTLVLVAEGGRATLPSVLMALGWEVQGQGGQAQELAGLASAEVCRLGPLRELCLLQGPHVGCDLPGPAVASLVLGPAEGSRVLAQPARLGGCWLVSPALQRRGQARGRPCRCGSQQHLLRAWWGESLMESVRWLSRMLRYLDRARLASISKACPTLMSLLALTSR